MTISEGGTPVPNNPRPDQTIKVQVITAEDISKYVSACPICYSMTLVLYKLNKFVQEINSRVDVAYVKCKDCECEAPLASWNMIRVNRPDPLTKFTLGTKKTS